MSVQSIMARCYSSGMQFRGHPPLPREVLLPVLDLCRSAAAAILRHYDPESMTTMPFWRKDDRSPLTAADLESHRISLAAWRC
jgi:3'-phosphoadenosine 5'-phosphosulfate (PAPS) 3'-phosphatase